MKNVLNCAITKIAPDQYIGICEQIKGMVVQAETEQQCRWEIERSIGVKISFDLAIPLYEVVMPTIKYTKNEV